MERMTAFVHGNVQAVGFRWWTRSRALELGLTGYAANKADGRVQVVTATGEGLVVTHPQLDVEVAGRPTTSRSCSRPSQRCRRV